MHRRALARTTIVSMERYVEEENELVTLFINNRELDVKKKINSKEVLNCYVQKFHLDKPVYEVRVVNENSPQYRIFIAHLRVDEKIVSINDKVFSFRYPK